MDVSEQYRGVKDSFTQSSILISLISLFSVVLWAWMPPVWGSTEAREVQVVDRMLSTGELLLPLRNGTVPSKPPMFHWFAAALSAPFGETSPYLVRITSALFAFGSLLVLMQMTRKLALISEVRFSSRADAISLSAGVICSTTYLFASLSGNARVDMCFSFFVTCAVAVIARVVARSPLLLDRRASDIALFSLATGFATLAKGPLGLALPLLFLLSSGLYLWGVRATIRLIVPHWAMIIYPLVVLPWYIAATMKAGGAFIERQIFFENFKRVVGDDHMNSEPFWFYVPEFFRSLAPWSILVVIALYILFKTEFIKRSTIPEVDITLRKVVCLPLLWIGLGLILFSLASGKRPSYLLPLVAPWSMVCAAIVVLSHDALSLRARRWVWTPLAQLREGIPYLLLLLMGAIELLRYVSVPQYVIARQVVEWTLTHASALQAAFLLAIAAILAFKQSWMGSLASFLVVFHFVFYYGAALKGHLKGFDRSAEKISARVGTEKLTAYKERFDEYLDPVFYYLKREVTVGDPEELRSCSGWILAKKSVVDSWRDKVELSEVSDYVESAPPKGREQERTITLARCRH